MSPPSTLRRPRNIGSWRAAAMLYGDWGTSKAYVTGLAFAIAMYSSFWLVLAVGVLILIVGLNYIWVCKYYPSGGGVYASARAHSQILAMVGGLLLVANYIVTAALSGFVSFLYFGFSPPEAVRWAAVSIIGLGLWNFFGPRHSGGLAIILGAVAAGAVALLALACVPQIPAAIQQLQLPHAPLGEWWVAFVGVILALSGVESVANLTGVMKLDKGSSEDQPSVFRTARRAILPVMVEVCLLTTLFGLAMHAIPNMDRYAYEGNMLRHMAEVFVDQPLAQLPLVGVVGELRGFSLALSGAMGLLLLSATNTALVSMVSVVYLMAQDGELPQPFTMLNRHGVPWILMLLAIIAPVLVVEIFTVGDRGLRALADLYAIGVIGTITVNLGSCAFHFRLPMPLIQRIVMGSTALLMLLIWLTIAVTKPHALLFASVVLAAGFGARVAARGPARMPMPARASASATTPPPGPAATATRREKINSILVATRQPTPALDFALHQARLHSADLYVLFIRQIAVNVPVTPRPMESDGEAMAVFNHVRESKNDLEFVPLYAISDDPAATILDVSASLGVDLLVLGGSHRNRLQKILRGDIVSAVARDLPEDINLLIYG